MGMYHIGVMLALKEAGITPRIIAGSSAGSIVAACIAVRGLDDLYDHHQMNYSAFPEGDRRSLLWHLKRYFQEGYLMDNKALVKFLRDNIGDYTFQEAYDKTGWILNITATGASEHDENRLLNYLTAPNVLIWSACAASCALPYVFGATEIYCKNADGQIETYVPFKRMFVDGSIGADLPMNNLSVLFNVNTFVVSQTNPWYTLC
jgi:predicted acylesterase/phospholipase RssA